MLPTEQTQLELIQKKFSELKNEKGKIKGNSVLLILKPLFKSINETDFEAIFKNETSELGLNEHDKMVTLEQLKYIYLSIQQCAQKIKNHPPRGVFINQQYYTLKKSELTLAYLPQISNQSIFNILSKDLTEIVPYQLIFFDSLYKRQDRPSIKTPQKLTEQSLQEIYYCYDYKIYQSLIDNFQSPQMNKLVQLFYKVIDFRWIEAANLLNQQIVKDKSIKQVAYLIPVFENLKSIQQEINKNGDFIKPIVQKRKKQQYPTLQTLPSEITRIISENKSIHLSPQTSIENLSAEIMKKINQIKNMFGFVCSYCAHLYKMFQNPYVKAIGYFLGSKFLPDSNFQQICFNQNLGVMIRFLFARRFLAPQNFKRYYEKFLIETKQNPKIQHIMFLKSKSDVVQTISNYWDNHPNQLEKVALTCGIVIHKLGKGFNKQHKFLQEMVTIYEYLLKTLKQKQIHKQYMVKMMQVRSSKQPIWQDLIIKPQFRLNCQTRSDDCVFLSMLQKFLYGGQQKWNKLKNKSTSPNDQSKKHYQVQTKHCPYCNHPTPRCSICLEQIKIFTVKSYINQQIKRKPEKIDKNDKQQKPYMKLNQLIEQALIWCPKCGHGGHFGHLQSWFKQGKSCPVDRCQCRCKY